MAFNELELMRIDGTVGVLCRRKSPDRVKDQRRLVYEVDGHSVCIFEERPRWDDPVTWTRSAIAKFRYFRCRKEWALYWMRRDLKWHRYETSAPAKDLADLVAVVNQDRYGTFFR
jgi:hypothetical protein